MKQNRSNKDKRDFIRLDSVFPVQFQFWKEGKVTGCLEHHGFTGNVSKGGLCLEMIRADDDTIAMLKAHKDIKLHLKIHIPIHLPAVEATAKVSWFREEESQASQYLVGLKYEQIDAKDVKRIMRFAYSKTLAPRMVMAAVIILFFAFAASTYKNIQLSAASRKLIEEMVGMAKEARFSRDELGRIQRERLSVEEKFEEANKKIKQQEEAVQQKTEELKLVQNDNLIELKRREREIEALKAVLVTLEQSKTGLEDKIGGLLKEEEGALVKLGEIKEKKEILEKANFEKMYQWVKIHQNPRTGLIASFEGDGELGDIAFTYDQALAVIAFSYRKEYDLAGKILDFYLSRAHNKNGFYNGYYVSSGDVSEFIVHSGPNLWLGIAALQYTQLSGDKKYLSIARDIATWMLRLQKEDKEGGLRGGPETPWYSTEHNLDGVSFFTMFYKITRESAYRKASEFILSWLQKHAYDSPSVPVKRGRGDATIATDTYAWSIASIGAQKLIAMGMKPEEIMKFAEDNCGVSLQYTRPSGENILVKGFDFAKQQHMARGGVISCEWTAQMILSYKLLSRYFASTMNFSKEKLYKEKAEEYLEELTKMIIASSSRTGQGEGCLPYASSDFEDTGHGWRTPKGKNTGSLSATIYSLFAYYGFNPLELE
ncbi:MAG TPA: hypothetical protein DEQ77_08065 [Candidatus Omnitrophica bacterium]|nr:hypothetical protein [Candidatus Omnitrophota bacterium]